jgi:hypothetical protein
MQCGGKRWRPGEDGEGKPTAGDVDYIGEDGGTAEGEMLERREGWISDTHAVRLCGDARHCCYCC